MSIAVKQIDNLQLTAFITNVSTGASLFSGSFINYVSSSGYMGPLVVTITGNQSITGVKTFQNSPLVPYSGGTGAAPSTQFVIDLVNTLSGSSLGAFVSRAGSNDIISGLKTFTGALQVGVPTNSGHALNLGYATGILSAIKITGSQVISIANFTGIGGATVLYSGGLIYISASGGGGGGGSSNTSVTGSAAIAAPNFTGVGSAVVSYNGTYVLVSGAASTLITGSSPILLPNFTGAGTTVVSYDGTRVLVSGGANTINQSTFNITGTGTVNITTSGTTTVNMVSGVLNTNPISIGTITGNFVNISFFNDPVFTGLNLLETFVSNNFTFTGAAFACRTSGSSPLNGGILSGKLYQVDFNNTEQTLLNFAFTTGSIYSGSPTFSTLVTGGNRVGLSLTNSLSGIQKFTVGIFGV